MKDILMKMSHRRTCLWSFLVLSLCTVNCDVVYTKVGEKINLQCTLYTRNQDISWLFKTELIGREPRTGTPVRGTAPMSQRSQFSQRNLYIKEAGESDAGEYSCEVSGMTLKLSVMTYKCSAQPTGPSFQNEAVNIQCNVMGGAKVKWTCGSPSGSSMTSDSGSFKVNPVKISDGGNWQCFFEENGKKYTYSLQITIIGLMPSANVAVQEGASLILPCVLHSKINLKPTNIIWERLSPNPSRFLVAESSKEGELKKTVSDSPGDFKNVKFSTENLKENFSVTLTNAKASQTGTYRCSVKFDKEKTIMHEVMLVVNGQDAAKEMYPGYDDIGSGVQSKEKSILGIEQWIWIAIGVGCFVLITLVIVAVIVYQKKKSMKRKSRKMRAMKHALMPRDYCHCNRGQPGQLGQPGQPNGKRREHRHTSDARGSKERKPAEQRNQERQEKVP
ncbi:CD4-2 molecule, tandem duplicate 2 isoform X2 [Brienomyrus brachyistius]|nr:CD4-2 molecule, tandem duplicate 2 isoform X2 [Brienomyrus brachyistius]XP_048880974.1 CD4-2 molecule, tandem duplicate 2 isoform X2 [Brienomyrus brachyistius]